MMPLKEYTLWLELTDRKTKKLIQTEQKNIGSPIFLPHVTLLGGINEKEDTIKQKLKAFSNEKNFIIKFKKVTYSKEKYQTVFLECVKSRELIGINKKAQEIFGMNKKYKPHMSLNYGEIDLKTKRVIVKKIKKIDIKNFDFTVKKITLWKAFGTVENWRRVASIKLG